MRPNRKDKFQSRKWRNLTRKRDGVRKTGIPIRRRDNGSIGNAKGNNSSDSIAEPGPSHTLALHPIAKTINKNFRRLSSDEEKSSLQTSAEKNLILHYSSTSNSASDAESENLESFVDIYHPPKMLSIIREASEVDDDNESDKEMDVLNFPDEANCVDSKETKVEEFDLLRNSREYTTSTPTFDKEKFDKELYVNESTKKLKDKLLNYITGNSFNGVLKLNENLQLSKEVDDYLSELIMKFDCNNPDEVLNSIYQELILNSFDLQRENDNHILARLRKYITGDYYKCTETSCNIKPKSIILSEEIKHVMKSLNAADNCLIPKSNITKSCEEYTKILLENCLAKDLQIRTQNNLRTTNSTCPCQTPMGGGEIILSENNCATSPIKPGFNVLKKSTNKIYNKFNDKRQKFESYEKLEESFNSLKNEKRPPPFSLKENVGVGSHNKINDIMKRDNYTHRHLQEINIFNIERNDDPFLMIKTNDFNLKINKDAAGDGTIDVQETENLNAKVKTTENAMQTDSKNTYLGDKLLEAERQAQILKKIHIIDSQINILLKKKLKLIRSMNTELCGIDINKSKHYTSDSKYKKDYLNKKQERDFKKKAELTLKSPEKAKTLYSITDCYIPLERVQPRTHDVTV